MSRRSEGTGAASPRQNSTADWWLAVPYAGIRTQAAVSAHVCAGREQKRKTHCEILHE